MKKTWWKESVVYQIYPRSFCDSNGDGIGDLKGICSKLDYLKELGIDVIWLSPIYKSPNDDNGYDISDYEDIMEEFGSMADFEEVLNGCHARGIKLVMDLVVNHTSDEHPWFIESRQSRNNDKRDYYIWRDPVDGHEPTNWGSAFSGSAWQMDEKTGQYYLHLFSKKQPDLNWNNARVRREVFDMMTRWCEKGIDGFRMDVISLISKPDVFSDFPTQGGLYGPPEAVANGPHVHEYLQEMNREVLSQFDLMTVGETAGVTLEEAKKYANSRGTELGMVFQFEHVGLDQDPASPYKWSTMKMPLVPLKENLSKWQTGLDGCAWNSLFFCNHDQPRIVSRLGDDSDQYRERSAKAIATILHMMQGTPYIYQGEELGMTNAGFSSVDQFRDLESINAYWELTEKAGMDPKDLLPMIAHKSRDNARTPMQWSDAPQAGFTKGKPWIDVNPNYVRINAKEQLGRKDSVFSYYKKLIALRHASDLIVYGHYRLLLPEDPDLFVYTREWEGKSLLVAANFSTHEREYRPDPAFAGGKVLIQNIEGHDPADGRLAPYEAYVLEV